MFIQSLEKVKPKCLWPVTSVITLLFIVTGG